MRYPDKVKRLILNGANLYPAGVKASVQIPIVLGYRIASFFAERSPEAKANAEMLGLMVNDPNLSEKDLEKVTCRTLVIAGKDDMIKQEHTKMIHKGIKNSELVILEGNHFVANKNSEKFNKVVYDFMMEGNGVRTIINTKKAGKENGKHRK